MIFVCEYMPAAAVVRGVGERGPWPRFHMQYDSIDVFDKSTLPAGDWIIYESKGEPDHNGIQPRLEVVDYIRVHPPAASKVSTVKNLG